MFVPVIVTVIVTLVHVHRPTGVEVAAAHHDFYLCVTLQ